MNNWQIIALNEHAALGAKVINDMKMCSAQAQA